MSAVREIDVPLLLDSDCGACAERLREGLAEHRGIVDVVPRADGRTLGIRYDPDLCSLGCVTEAADEMRLDLARRFTHEVERVEGMDCYDCAQTIERALARMPGVTQASVNFPAARLLVEYEPDAIALDQVNRRVESLGYRVVRDGAAPDAATRRSGLTRGEVPTAASAVLLLIGLLVDLVFGLGWPATAAYAAAALVGGLPIARAGLAALRATARPDINLLMSIAVVGAAAIGAWVEAGLVVVLFSVGSALEGRAVERARRELAGLVALAPETARVRRRHAHGDGEVHEEEIELPVSELTVGDVLVIRPGERVPADGEVIEGTSSIDQAPITGESTPVDKTPGDTLFAGSLNVQGLLIAAVTTQPGDTAIEKIGRLVAEAQSRKSPSERWVDSFARLYTPIVIVAAALVALVPLAFGGGAHDSVYAALALLILACPCALVISTPVAIVSALGRASAAGVLVKGGAHLEAAARIRTVAFDKTGTLTLGRPAVRRVVPLDGDEDGLIRLAASLEQGSEHPLARAIVEEARRRGLTLVPVSDFEALRGLGARARVGGDVVEIGNGRLFGAERLAGAGTILDELRESGQTAVVVARQERIVGLLGLADEVRPEAAAAIADLGRLGIRRTVLLTGDNEFTALAVGVAAGVSETRFELLPDEKAAIVGELGPGTAMVGDGVNDAPALAGADVGIAMGSAGSDAAVEVADVALMGDDPRKVAGLIGLARWSRSIVTQNVAFSLSTKLVAVGFLAAGALPLWAAVASDVGASLVVVANGLRLVGGRPLGALRRAPMLPSARGARQVADPASHEHGTPTSPFEDAAECACCTPQTATALRLRDAADPDES